MQITKCKMGHFYDKERYGQCPQCEIIAQKEGGILPSRFAELGTISVSGNSSTGRVYKIQGENIFALKAIPCSSDQNRYEKALYERKVMERLKGVPGAVWLRDSEIVERDGERTVYLLEEYDTSLSYHLSTSRLSVADIIEIMIGVCSALIDCKNAGVAHLDVQPVNIFITDTNSVKIGNFSSSLFWEDLKSNGTMRGTLDFMAPEVYREGRCSERSDIYSAGIVLYYLFNERKLPFMDSYSKEAAILKRLKEPHFPDMAYSDVNVKPEILRIIEKACEYDPDKRIPNFEILQETLKNLYEQVSGTDAGRTCLFPDIWSWVKTNTIVSDGDSTFLGAMLLSSSGQGDGDGSHTVRLPAPVPDFALPPVACQAESAPVSKRKSVLDRIAEIGSSYIASEKFAKKKKIPVNHAPVNRPVVPHPPAASRTVGRNLFCPMCGNRVEYRAIFCNRCGSKLPAAEKNPEVNLKKVHFSAIAPKTFIKGDYTMIRVVMYEEAFRHMVDEILKAAEEPVGETRSGLMNVQLGSTIRICLTSPDIEIDDNEEVGEWRGEYLNFSFGVLLPEEYKKREILFSANVYVNDVIATRLKFLAKCSSLREQKLAVSREDILSAFVSYASQDRNRVATIIQGMKKARPDMDVFFDVDSLRSGDDWEKALRNEIEKRDILFLCWSHFARQSKWVDTEWRYALERKGIECIEPVPIEPPNICPPPEELKQKHFNDKLLYIINAGGNESFEVI